MQGILLGQTGVYERFSWAGNERGPRVLARCWGTCLLHLADLAFGCKELEERSGLHGNMKGE